MLNLCSNSVATHSKQHHKASEAVMGQGGSGDRSGDRKGVKEICEVAKAASQVSSDKKSNGQISGDIKNLFSYWQQVIGKPKAKLDSKRRGKISQALQSYSFDQLKLAIDGCASSKYHMGENDSGKAYNDIELIFRDAKHVEQFIEYQQCSDSSADSTVNSDLMKGAI